jgi:hypothetical protein
MGIVSPEILQGMPEELKQIIEKLSVQNAEP